MQIIVCKNYEEISVKGAEILAGQIKVKADSVLGLATGNSPIGIYDRLCLMHRVGALDFSAVSTFNLDEYLPIDPEDPNSYCAFMHEHLWDKVNIRPENCHIPAGNIPLEEAEAMCRQYDKSIEEAGGIDLQLLGIGRNGHIGFNEPADKLIVGTHVTGLTESTVEANSVLFPSPDQMPRHAVTMGMGTIAAARRILLIANGKSKHEALMGLIGGEITTALPASLLQLHPNVTVICDEEAYYG